jgi:hypothetical protein
MGGVAIPLLYIKLYLNRNFRFYDMSLLVYRLVHAPVITCNDRAKAGFDSQTERIIFWFRLSWPACQFTAIIMGD